MSVSPFPDLKKLQSGQSLEGAVSIAFQENIPVFRASSRVQERVELLLDKNREHTLTVDERGELDHYLEMDDYLSWLNRVVRNQLLQQAHAVT